MKCKSGWRRELGTSKREQGILTPKAPWNRRGQRRYVARGPQPLFGLAEFIAALMRKER